MELLTIKKLHEICEREIALGHSNYNVDLTTGGYYDGLASTETYNENGGWTIEQENELRSLLIRIHNNKGRFALSNNLTTNTTLQQWAEDNGFIIHDLTNTYSNCNYQKKDKDTKDLEVLITNY